LKRLLDVVLILSEHLVDIVVKMELDDSMSYNPSYFLVAQTDLGTSAQPANTSLGLSGK
jgi:hypothetical protein